ncbi:uncharacterized protein CANTADRAFT_149142 [Suhomyces tanzawaensis NRRL Y-17324]|uniref:Uncharacterized protein n=1 Tax=Suhomyces tanzawaensis NRRL Y-17324 TaxID=984487 RepID=A0A1E4SB15_9ASCO|nr:uncharacterized protein CANTADRAFT_149142 [Suhomyces tanzawaensis NRRL Y-17324]ODV76691.1 hypothetical protein CANTADRAFT_149142 [Suhomyces tanzawaensis NRRL Y-17324]
MDTKSESSDIPADAKKGTSHKLICSLFVEHFDKDYGNAEEANSPVTEELVESNDDFELKAQDNTFDRLKQNVSDPEYYLAEIYKWGLEFPRSIDQTIFNSSKETLDSTDDDNSNISANKYTKKFRGDDFGLSNRDSQITIESESSSDNSKTLNRFSSSISTSLNPGTPSTQGSCSEDCQEQRIQISTLESDICTQTIMECEATSTGFLNLKYSCEFLKFEGSLLGQIGTEANEMVTWINNSRPCSVREIGRQFYSGISIRQDKNIGIQWHVLIILLFQLMILVLDFRTSLHKLKNLRLWSAVRILLWLLS